MSHAPARILIVDDEPVQTLILQRWLASKGHTDLCLESASRQKSRPSPQPIAGTTPSIRTDETGSLGRAAGG